MYVPISGPSFACHVVEFSEYLFPIYSAAPSSYYLVTLILVRLSIAFAKFMLFYLMVLTRHTIGMFLI